METRQKIGKFTLLEKIGQGGMADVYLAEANYNGLRKIVALKRILQALSSNAHFQDTFRYEAELSMELNHPNVVQVFEYGQTASAESEPVHLYMVMEYVDGVDLMKLIRKSRESKPLPLGLSAYIIAEVLRGLDYAHRLVGPDGRLLELVHRDMSPQNILLSREGAVKVTDFGIAKALGHNEEEGILRGKLHYMSPEQARTEAVDCRSDIFAVGLILYEMVSGVHPYATFKGHKALEAAIKAEISPPSLVNPQVPIELERILQKALAPHKEDRYQRARDMQVDLSRFLHGLPDLYDASTLVDFLGELFPEQDERVVLRATVPRESRTMGTSESETGHFGPDGHFTLDTYTLAARYKESKSLVALVLRLGTQQAEARLGHERVMHTVNQFFAMVQNILLKDKRNRYRYQRRGDREFLVVRGIPYTGEYDESEMLRDAHIIRRDFSTFCEKMPELQLQACVYRLAVTLEHDTQTIRWTVNETEYQEALRWGAMFPGEIVVSPFIYAAAKYNWEMEVLKDDPENPLHRLVRQKRRDERLQSRVGPVFIGREYELERIRDLFHEVQEKSKPQWMLIVGDMGIGKSALIQEFVRTSTVRMEVIRAESRPYLQHAAFGFIMDFVRDFAKLNVDDSSDVTLRDFSRALAQRVQKSENREKIFHAFQSILESQPEKESALQNLGAQITQALKLLLGEIASMRPLVAVFEDMQWADEQSKRTLQEILENTQLRGAILFLFTGRERSDFPSFFMNSEMIHLQPFDAEKARRFVMSRFASPEHAQPVVNAIIANGEGNPFYLNEMLASLVDTGVCRTEGPERKLVPVRQISTAFDVKAFPTLEGILSARVDALEPELRRILRIAAVLGRKFNKAALDRACGVDTGPALEIFIRKQLIRPLENEGRYSFTQSIMRDYCYATLPEEERVEAHRIQAETILASPGYKPAIDDVIVARHLELSGQKQRAAQYYLQSAHHARRFGKNANQEALSHYQKVLELMPNEWELVFHARRDREWIWRNMGMREEQFAEIQAMRQLAETTNNLRWRAEALCRELAYYQETGETKKTEQLAAEAKQTAQLAQDPFFEVEVLRIQARFDVDKGKLDDALDKIETALEIVASNPTIERLRADIMHVKGNALFYRGRVADAMKAYEKALEGYQQYQRTAQASAILMNLGFVSAMQGYYEKALEYYKQSYLLDREKGEVIYTGLKLANLAQAHIDLGNYEYARKLIKQAKVLCKRTRDKSALADALFTSGLLRLRMGRYEDAMYSIHEGLQLATQAASIMDEIRGRLLYAECEILNPNGSGITALEQAKKATDLARNAEAPVEFVHALSLQARANYKLSEYSAAMHLSSQAVALTVVQPVPGQEVVYYYHGKILQVQKYMNTLARMFLIRAKDEVMRKAQLITQEPARQTYLSVYPAFLILQENT